MPRAHHVQGKEHRRAGIPPRYLSNFLSFSTRLGYLFGEIIEEATQSGQALIAGADVVAPLGLEITEKLTHALGGNVFSAETGDRPVTFRSHESEKQFDRIAVTLDRCRAHPLVYFEALLEERKNDWSDRCHGALSIDGGVAKRPGAPAGGMQQIASVGEARVRGFDARCRCPPRSGNKPAEHFIYDNRMKAAARHRRIDRRLRHRPNSSV